MKRIIFGMIAILVVLLAFMYFRKARGLYLDSTNLSPEFIAGFRDGCDVLGVAPVVDGSSIPPGAVVITAKPDMYPANRRVSVGVDDANAIAVIDVDVGAMIKAAVEYGMSRRAHRFVFLYSDDAMAQTAYPTSVYIRTTPERALEDSFAVVQTRVVDAFVVLDENLEFDRARFQESKLLIACGYKSDAADASVYYDSREQGYLAAVLAMTPQPLFMNKKVRTKMYTT